MTITVNGNAKTGQSTAVMSAGKRPCVTCGHPMRLTESHRRCWKCRQGKPGVSTKVKRLPPEDVRLIRALNETEGRKLTAQEVAEKFEVCRQCVQKIWRYQTHRNVR